MVRYSGSVYRRANDIEKQIQRVDIPSYIVTPGDVISFADKSQDPPRIMELLEAAEI
jgi:ribosomal protein S4